MAAPINHDSVIILDFGSQYTHLIARRVRGELIRGGTYKNQRWTHHSPASVCCMMDDRPIAAKSGIF